MHNKEIHLAICFDENYIVPFYALLTSIFQNNKNNKIFIHSIVTGINDNQEEELKSFVIQNSGEVTFYDLDPDQLKGFPEAGAWSVATFYRLFIPHLLQGKVDKVIYLDTDIIVIGDLWPFYEKELGNKPIAAVSDGFAARPDLGIAKRTNYFNAGVMLINIQEWQKQQITNKAITFMMANPDKIIFQDQCALNAVLVNNWLKLDMRYNFAYVFVSPIWSKKDIKKYLKGKVIVHYTTKHKPWKATCRNRLRYLYFEYLKKSPVYNTGIKYTDFNWQPSLLKEMVEIRLKELYFDNPWFGRIRRIIKL